MFFRITGLFFFNFFSLIVLFLFFSFFSSLFPVGDWNPSSGDVDGIGLGLRFGPVEHLEEGRGLGPHPGVNVGLGALDVIVQIVSEQVYQVDGVVPGRAIGVAREEDEGDVADPVSGSGVGAL